MDDWSYCLGSVVYIQAEDVVLNEEWSTQWFQQKGLRISVWRIVIALKNYKKKNID